MSISKPDNKDLLQLDKNRTEKLISFEEKYDIKFKDLNALNQAFFHTSFIRENNLDESLSYERLEFLGDAVLKLAISEILFSKYEDYQEGKLSKIRSHLVSDRNIYNYALKLGFEEMIVLGKNEKNHGGAKKESILACSFEAFLGAVFLEYKSRGYKKVKDFLEKNFIDDILSMENKTSFLNPKAILQEYTQGLNHKLPEYILINETGQEHEKTFFVEVKYGGKILGKGSAKSIKSAQQEAALDALINLKILKDSK